MKFLIASLLSAALFATAAPALAQKTSAAPGMSHGLGAPAYRSAMYWSQVYTVTGEMTSTAKMGNVGTANNGFGISNNVTTMPGATVAVLPRAGGLAGVVTRESALSAMKTWYDNAAVPFVGTMSTWLRTKGVSQGYFNFSQEVNVSTVTGVRKQIIAWSGFVENSGRAVYGYPKLVDPDPTIVEVIYWSRTADSELPAHWKYEEGGKLSYRVMDMKFQPQTNWTHIDTNGAYDETEEEQSATSHAVRCLVDKTGITGCPAHPNVKELMLQTGSTSAIMTYVHQLEPVYKEANNDPNSEEMEPVRAYAYDDRVWLCNKLENSGTLGYLLTGDADTFFVSEGTPRYTHVMVANMPFNALSATEPFAVQATLAELEGKHPASVLISPFPRREFWSIPSKEASAAVRIAPIRVNPVKGAAAISPVSSDVYVSQQVNGNVYDYTIGSIGDNYFRGGVHTRSVTFSVENVDELEEFRLLNAGYDDHLLIRLNGHLMYGGPLIGAGSHYTVGDTGWDYFSLPQTFCYGGESETCYTYDSGGLGSALPEAPLSCQVQKWVDLGDSGYSYWETVDNSGPYYQGVHQGRGLCPVHQKIMKGIALPSWELSADWRVNINQDLRPWLVNGPNRLDIVLVVGGKGEFWFNLRERRQSCGEALGIDEAVKPPLGVTKPDVENELEGAKGATTP